MNAQKDSQTFSKIIAPWKGLMWGSPISPILDNPVTLNLIVLLGNTIATI